MEPLTSTTTQAARLALSFLAALPLGWDQEVEQHTVGLRTFPLVSLGSCGLMLVAHQLGNGSADVSSRILQGLVTGIGFVGGGAILKTERSVQGTATAASLWNMAVVGAATATGLYWIAGILVLINFLSLRMLLPFKNSLDTQ